jgi:hypothetical protein
MALNTQDMRKEERMRQVYFRFYDLFPEPYRRLAKNNWVYDRENTVPASKYEALEFGFEWDKTFEGLKFWVDFSTTLHTYVTNTGAPTRVDFMPITEEAYDGSAVAYFDEVALSRQVKRVTTQKTNRTFIGRNFMALDRLGNTLTGGHDLITLSARLGYIKTTRNMRWTNAVMWVVDTTFYPLDGKGHCMSSFKRMSEMIVGSVDFMRRGNDVGLFCMSLLVVLSCIIMVLPILIYVGMSKLMR